MLSQMNLVCLIAIASAQMTAVYLLFKKTKHVSCPIKYMITI